MIAVNEHRSDIQRSWRFSGALAQRPGRTSMRGYYNSQVLEEGQARNGNRFVDITGKKFGRLTVIECVGRKRKYAVWKCVCECGTEVEAIGARLASGEKKSCGCLGREVTSERVTTHGETGSDLYATWRRMRSRCEYSGDISYPRYGGRGISVSSEFSAYEGFRDYVLSELGQKPTDGHSLDRIDNEGDYAPGNIRWSNRKEQARNRSSNVRFEYNGEQLTIAELAELAGVSYDVMQQRLGKRKWPMDKAMAQPVRVVNK